MSQIKKVKLNLKNISSILTTANKKQQKLFKKKIEQKNRKESKRKLIGEEKNSFKASLGNIQKSVSISDSSFSIFDKLFEFIGLILVGILVNSFGGIIKKVEEIIDNVLEFVKPVQSIFNIIMAFMKGEDLNDPKYDSDRKVVDGMIDKIDGYLEDIKKKMKPIEGIVERIQRVLGTYKSRSRDTTLAMRGDKEGFYNTKTKIFVEREWTKEERKKYKSGKIIYVRPKNDRSFLIETDDGAPPINDDSTTRIKDDHSDNVPKGATPSGNFDPGNDTDKQIYLHWTGGFYDQTPPVYHTVITGDGKAHYMNPYSDTTLSHTWKRNSKGVGISAAAMGHTPKEPYREHLSWAQTPLKDIQVNKMSEEAAKLALAWGWNKNNITIRNVMTHAEAAGLKDNRSPTPNYGPGGESPIRWDLSYLKKDGKPWSGGPILRNMIKKYMDKLSKNGEDSPTGEGGSKDIFTMVSPDQSKMENINQPMYEDLDDEEEMVNIIIEPINNVVTRYSYVPISKRTRTMNSSTTVKPSQIWSA